MPLRAAMPTSVMKPIIEATDNACPAITSAITLPIRASGMLVRMMIDKHRRLITLIEHHEDQREGHQRQDADDERGFLLRAEGAGELGACSPTAAAYRQWLVARRQRSPPCPACRRRWRARRCGAARSRSGSDWGRRLLPPWRAGAAARSLAAWRREGLAAPLSIYPCPTDASRHRTGDCLRRSARPRARPTGPRAPRSARPA